MPKLRNFFPFNTWFVTIPETKKNLENLYVTRKTKVRNNYFLGRKICNPQTYIGKVRKPV